MKDMPIVRLVATKPLTPEVQAWLHLCEKALNHTLNVTRREEWELALADFRVALVDLCYSGDRATYDAAIQESLQRFENRLHS